MKDAFRLDNPKCHVKFGQGEISMTRPTFPKSLTGAAENDLMAVAFMAAFAGILTVDRIMMLIYSV